MQSLLHVAFWLAFAFGLAAPVLSTSSFAQNVTPPTGYNNDPSTPDGAAMSSSPLAPLSTPSKTPSAAVACDTAPKAHPLPKHHASTSRHHKTPLAHKSGKGEPLSVTEAQQHLKNLGYYAGPVDGKLGRKTRTALKNFQRDSHLPVTGRLDTKTMAALRAADQGRKVAGDIKSLPTKDVGTLGDNLDSPAPAAPDFFATHPDYYAYYHQQYSDPMMLPHQRGDTPTAQVLPSRFGQFVATEQTTGTMKSYHVALNGQPLFGTENQPSVILISKTYQLDSEDAIIFTTYNDSDPVCAFENIIVTVKNDKSNNHYRIDNCTYGYEAEIKQNSLWIEFPEQDDKRAVGATFKYENGDLEKL